MAFISLSCSDRELKLRQNSLTTANLSMIFRLQNQGTYLNSAEGEIVLPDESGIFTIDGPDAQKKFTVNGNPIMSNPVALSQPSLSPSTAIGMLVFVDPTSRTVNVPG